jgi:molybdopterin-guanine dinucleotide biosynthesis adapter protein
MAIPVISIVGKTDSGKTTLIEKLIPALKERGVRVATIKHDAHRFDIDHPGKDTYRHYQSGAESVLIASKTKLALVKRLCGPMSLDDLINKYMEDMDLLITEGYKSGDKPKIEVFRKDAHKEPLCGPEDNLIAMVTDADVEFDVPSFGLNDVEKVADFIVKGYC